MGKTRFEKLNDLKNILNKAKKVYIAFSGGVDSTFLTCFAADVLGNTNVTAVTAVSSNFADDEIAYTKVLASQLGIKHICVDTALPEIFFQNPQDRCYHCKKAVFSQLIAAALSASNEKGSTIHLLDIGSDVMFCDGQNKDDESDYRPGSIAARELGVRSPLHEAGLTKAEIRETLREMNIDIWDKPAFACLASRIPYGVEITAAKLRAIYEIEALLRQNGFTQLRARLHSDIVRLELLPGEMPLLIADRSLCEELNTLAIHHGFSFTAIDIIGYRMGSLNQNIK